MKKRDNIRGSSCSNRSSETIVYEPKLGCVVVDLRPWGTEKFEIATFDCVRKPS